MKNNFSGMLAGLRKGAGFDTAYRFYHDNGGKPVLGFSYRKWLFFEQGAALPSAAELKRISLALKLIPKSPAAGRLAAAWLAALAGEETYADVFEPFISVKTETPGLSPLHRAMGRVLKKHPISVSQAAAILQDFDHYRAFLVLFNDEKPWTAERLAAATGLKKGAAAGILGDLSETGLLKKAGKGSYEYRVADLILEFPRAEIMPRGLNGRMREYQSRLAASGADVWRRMTILRADAGELTAFYPVMAMNISAAGAYAVEEKTERSAMFAVEGRVVKLFDF